MAQITVYMKFDPHGSLELQTVPRQKTYIYIFLISLTGLLIYFYSYPLSTEHWTYIRQTTDNEAKTNNGGQFQASEKPNGYPHSIKDTGKSIGSSVLRKFLPDLSKSTLAKGRQLKSTDVTTNGEMLSSTGMKSDDTSRNIRKNHTRVLAKEDDDDASTTKVEQNVLSTSSGKKTEISDDQKDFASITNAAKITEERNSGEILDEKSSSENISLTTKENTETITKTTENLTKANHPIDYKPFPLPVYEGTKDRTGNTDLRTTPRQPNNEGIIQEASTPPNLILKNSSITQSVMAYSKSTIYYHENQATTNENKSSTTKEQVGSLTKTAKDATNVSSPVNKSLPVYKDDKSEPELIDVKTTTNQTNSESKIHEVSTTPEPVTQPVTISSDSTLRTPTSESVPDIQKGYLVFSEHCRIPDIDPMHPSIAHLISKTPPLDCSKDYTPLTRTKGHVLYLNRTSVLKLTAGDNYTCCYRSVFREKEGQSDNSVGFGENCITITDEATVQDEFISVECWYDRNGTAFYEEFHSFIFDKPKVEKRCNSNNKVADTRYSVLIVGADSVSRLNMHRQLNATARYLLEEMDAVEMYGFNKVGDNTFPNLTPLLVGYDERELPSVCWKSEDTPLDRCDFLWKRFAKSGYRTLYAEDSPHISSFNYVKKGFYLQPTDYYFRPFILAYEDALGRDKPLNCYLCVGSTSETEAVLHWTRQFASHFADGRPYFAFSWINSVTHDYLNMGSSADHMYHGFFRELHRTGALDRTVVVLMGDHGMRWGDIRSTYVGRLEERLPMLLVSLPREFKRRHPEFARNLRENSRRLVTPFDLHATLAHLLNLTADWEITPADDIPEGLRRNFTRRAKSLFLPVPKDRSCDEAFVDEHWCTCESSLEVSNRRDDVKRVAEFLLKSINDLLNPVSDKCATLKLDSVSGARLWQPPTEHKGHSEDDDRILTAVIHTSPGKAVFEGTVKMSHPRTDCELLGTISRLNLYGNQSSCVNDAVLKKYCFCL